MYLRLRLAVVAGLFVFGFASIGPLVQPAAAYTWTWPTRGRVTQTYGCTGFKYEPAYGGCRHFHKGYDVANDPWTKIRAASSGVVKYVGYNPYDPSCCQAWIVKIRHDNGLVGLYAHMKPVRVSGARAGDRVKAGQLIGYMGSTGMSTGTHLHFGLFRDGSPVNPKKVIGYSCCSLSYSTGAAAMAPTIQLPSPDRWDETPRLRPDRAPADVKRYPLSV